jgi:hypothetical protein
MFSSRLLGHKRSPARNPNVDVSQVAFNQCAAAPHLLAGIIDSYHGIFALVQAFKMYVYAFLLYII